jgi:hypothetical protein
MAMYCICEECKKSKATPSAGMVQGPIEQIRGQKVEMKDSWTLAHWSGKKFTEMVSREIHEFFVLEHQLRVGVSLYLYRGAAPPAPPNQFSRLGLAGGNRYTIDHTLANNMEIYYKSDPNHNPAEVTVVLGCGGKITFDDRQRATDYKPNKDKCPHLDLTNR